MFGEGDSLKIGGLGLRNRSHLERVTQLMRILFAL